MMKQMTLATAKGFEVHGRAKRKAEFLARMEGLVPWAEMCGLIESHYPKAGNGRPPVGLGRERVPDSTTLVNFRHLLEPHELGAAVFAKVGQLLQANGMKLSGGTIVDATLIAAPPSTKRQEHSRDPEMHQSKMTLPAKNVSLAEWFNPSKENGNDEHDKEGALHARIQARGRAAGRRRPEHCRGGTLAGGGGPDAVQLGQGASSWQAHRR